MTATKNAIKLNYGWFLSNEVRGITKIEPLFFLFLGVGKNILDNSICSERY